MTIKTVHKSFIVFSWSPFGIKLYVSHLGYYAGNRYCYMWEPGFENARHFETKDEAMLHAERAAEFLPSHNQYNVASYKVKDNNTTTIKIVYTGGLNVS